MHTRFGTLTTIVAKPTETTARYEARGRKIAKKSKGLVVSTALKPYGDRQGYVTIATGPHRPVVKQLGAVDDEALNRLCGTLHDMGVPADELRKLQRQGNQFYNTAMRLLFQHTR